MVLSVLCKFHPLLKKVLHTVKFVILSTVWAQQRDSPWLTGSSLTSETGLTSNAACRYSGIRGCERGWHGEEVAFVVVERAERCEDNNPNGEICKAGVLYEAWSVCCEGVLNCTQKLNDLEPTHFFTSAAHLLSYCFVFHIHFVYFLFLYKLIIVP